MIEYKLNHIWYQKDFLFLLLENINFTSCLEVHDELKTKSIKIYVIVEYDKLLGKGRPLTLLRNYILMIPGIQIMFFAFKLQVLKYGPWWKALHKYYFCALLMKASESYITIKNVFVYIYMKVYVLSAIW